MAPIASNTNPSFSTARETDLYLQALHQTYAGRMLVKI